MNKSFILALAASTALAGCATTAESPTVAETAAAAPAPEPAPKAAIGSFGFDSAGMDRSIAPGDDFYNYSGGTYLRNTPIPGRSGQPPWFCM